MTAPADPPEDDSPARSHGRLSIRASAKPRDLMGPPRLAGAWTAKVLTLFPSLFPGPLGASLTGRALEDGRWALDPIDIRAFATDRHRSVDAPPAGGGPGMVMRPDVVAAAIDAADEGHPREDWPVLHLSPRGRPFTQARAAALARTRGVTLLCGRFEGVDQRVLDARGVEEVSVGDFVMTGGEIPAMCLIDATVRLIPRVLGNAESTEEESFSHGLLEHPQYTRPKVWEGREIPEVLLSGHHADIAAWRRSRAEALTKERRPDLWRASAQADADPDGEAELSDARTSAANGGKKKDD